MGRKVPFSGKQKKEQLKAKRAQKRQTNDVPDSNQTASEISKKPEKIDLIANSDGKFFLQLQKMTKSEVKEGQLKAQNDALDLTKSAFKYREIAWPRPPTRPEWDSSLSKTQLEKNEENYFNSYSKNLLETEDLNRFEHNLETWRQLWRVVEKSDLIAIVADIRFPHLHVPMGFIDQVGKNKPVLLILNKIDLVPTEVVAKWFAFYSINYKEKISKVLLFSCAKWNPKMSKSLFEEIQNTCHLGPSDFLNTVDPEMIIDDWEEIDGHVVRNNFFLNEDREAIVLGKDREHITVGFVGMPNVGKSSVMNRLVGRKITKTGITPGVTKYFQTYNVSCKLTLYEVLIKNWTQNRTN